MNRYIKVTAALAAFALLLVVMGLSTSSSVQAQVGKITLTPRWVCSDCATNSVNIEVQDGTTVVTITNLDVAEVTDVNPKEISISGGSADITVVQEGTGPDEALLENEIRGFNGNRLEVEFAGTGGAFSTFATILVDNVDPSLVQSSPDVPLVVKGSTNVVFSADITDNGSGYTATEGTSGSSDIDDLNGTPGAVPDQGVPTTGAGYGSGTIHLVVAGNIVGLTKDNFEKIDGGWRVTKEINSSSIQGIGANTPWYWLTTDRAGNTKRSTDSIELKPVAALNAASGVLNNTLRDPRFIGNLQPSSFDGSQIEVKRGSDSIKLDVTAFDGEAGTFTFETPDSDDEGFGTGADASGAR